VYEKWLHAVWLLVVPGGIGWLWAWEEVEVSVKQSLSIHEEVDV